MATLPPITVVPLYPQGIGSRTLQIPKCVDARVPYVKWCVFAYNLLYTLNHLCIAYNTKYNVNAV